MVLILNAIRSACSITNKSWSVIMKYETAINTIIVMTVRTRRAFSADEDDVLRELVHAHGTDNWKKVADLMPNRSARQCKERWKYHIAPSISRSQWTPDEDAKLLRLYQQFGSNWASMTAFLPGRSVIHIRSRWLSIRRKMQAHLARQNTTSRMKAQEFCAKVTAMQQNNVAPAINSETATEGPDEFSQLIDDSDHDADEEDEIRSYFSL